MEYDFKIENIKERQVIKNYKELCKLLDIKVLNGNSKKAQLKDLERYCSYHKEGNKFIIDCIHNEIKEKIDLRTTGNNSIYINNVSDILIDYIYTYSENNQNPTILLSFSKLINILGLVNNTYTIGNNKKKELSDVLNIQLQAIHYFYNSSRNEFKRIIKTSLNNMQKRSIIKYSEKIMICKKGFGLNGRRIKYYTLATDDEISDIIDAQRKSLINLELDNLQQLFFKGFGNYKKFIKLTMDQLPKDWVFYFNVFEIIIGKNAIKQEYLNIREKRNELNTKSINKLERTFKIKEYNNKNERKLIDSLINLKNYNEQVDDEILKEYKINKMNYYNQVKETNKEILDLERIKEKITEDYENKDNIDREDYINYINNFKNKIMDGIDVNNEMTATEINDMIDFLL